MPLSISHRRVIIRDFRFVSPTRASYASPALDTTNLPSIQALAESPGSDDSLLHLSGSLSRCRITDLSNTASYHGSSFQVAQLPRDFSGPRESYRMSFRASTFGKGICAYSLPRWPLFGESLVTRIVTVGFFCLYNSLYSQFPFIALQLLISRGRAACFHSTDSWDSPTFNKWIEQHLTDSRPGKNTH